MTSTGFKMLLSELQSKSLTPAKNQAQLQPSDVNDVYAKIMTPMFNGLGDASVKCNLDGPNHKFEDRPKIEQFALCELARQIKSMKIYTTPRPLPVASLAGIKSPFFTLLTRNDGQYN
jgi:hypothetical protein